ncbi:hypothetical protein [Embleya scabrispora]|uniref:HNH endonuclease n=1 Tax=Embleya scabrispora TaxID=159449 RepID=UPI00316AE8DA
MSRGREGPSARGTASSPHRAGEQEATGGEVGGIPLRQQRSAKVVDRRPVWVDYPHKELITRLLADTCEICGRIGDVEVHHIRALADLAHSGWPSSDWARVMLDRRRKSVVACVSCHDRIHVARTAKSFTL